MQQAKPANTIFDRVINQLAAAAHSGTVQQTQDALSAAGIKSLLKLSKTTTSDGAGAEDAAAAAARRGEGDLQLGVAERMLKWHAEAMGRAIELSNPADL